MLRYFLLIMFLPLTGMAQKMSQADVKQLKFYSAGVFSNEAQVKSDAHFILSELNIKTLWPKRKDGVWLFCERKDTSITYQVWHIYLQDDSTMLMQFFDFKEKAKAIQLSHDINLQSSLYLNNLAVRNGCEVFFKKNKTSYTGTSLGKDCFVNQPGTEYITLTIAVNKNSIALQQASFDKDDKEVQGLADGNYIFMKQVKSLK